MNVNDRVLKRGTPHHGTVERVSPYGWVHVRWDLGPYPRVRPNICTVKELELLEA